MKITIHWFRNDLRLFDNPALLNAVARGRVLPIYILDDDNAEEFAQGGASRWWLHESLTSLNASLGGRLACYRGNPQDIIDDLLTRFEVDAVMWNRCYEPWRITRDAKIKQTLKSRDFIVESHNASLLWEPWTINKKDGTPYKVFTPYYRNGCLKSTPPRTPLPAPNAPDWQNDTQALSIDELSLLPKIAWHESLRPHWHIGEDGAHDALAQFIKNGLLNYKEGRDFPSLSSTSKLSPHLHFGEISPHQIWETIKHIADDEHVDNFCSELGWREFSYQLLYHNPKLPTAPLQTKFEQFPWNENPAWLKAWQRGQTGVPMVDAGMRELWQTGTMHNRVRMVVGSFLVKNLRLHWHHGASWFWDCLLDADLASNSASWQWIAGCGADAVPYFRVFNPVTQGEKFDADGHYIRKYIPEIADLPNKYLFSPWTAPSSVLLSAGVRLGKTYPQPLVDLKISRVDALEAFKTLKVNAT